MSKSQYPLTNKCQSSNAKNRTMLILTFEFGTSFVIWTLSFDITWVLDI